MTYIDIVLLKSLAIVLTAAAAILASFAAIEKSPRATAIADRLIQKLFNENYTTSEEKKQ